MIKSHDMKTLYKHTLTVFVKWHLITHYCELLSNIIYHNMRNAPKRNLSFISYFEDLRWKETTRKYVQESSSPGSMYTQQ